MEILSLTIFKKIHNFFVKDIWKTPLDSLKGPKGFFSKCMRIGYLASRGFVKDKCTMRSSALTYYSLMAFVPLIALALAIAGGLGYQEYLEKELYSRFLDHEALNTIVSLSKNVLEKTKGSLIAFLGILLIFWSLVKVLTHIEGAMNTIWQIKEHRSLRNKFTDYLSMMLLGPTFFLLSSSFTFFVIRRLESFVQSLALAESLSKTVLFFLQLIPYGLICILFFMIYYFMPSRRVPFISTFIGAFLAGAFYQALSLGYFIFQIVVTRYSAIYGSFAFLPLFLIWLQLSWIIVLAGAEVSFAISHLKTYELEKRWKDLTIRVEIIISLWVVCETILCFEKQKGYLTKESISTQLKIPSDFINRIASNLVLLGILSEVKDANNKPALMPARPYQDLTIKDIVIAIETKGEGGEVPLIEEKEMTTLKKKLEQFDELVLNSSLNSKITDIRKKNT